MSENIDVATDAIQDGQLVVYPTETVYGLGADALDADAVERVFEAKDRDRSQPVSMAVPTIEMACEYTQPSPEAKEFMQEFLPGPVTVVVERSPLVPDVLTAGSNRVGIRIPDHEISLELAEKAGTPVTSTSANVSGNPSARRLSEIDQRIQEYATAHIDGGETPGGGSTVVDVTKGEIHRRGPLAEEIEAWLDDQ